MCERAFEPFVTTKDVGKGSGLGLSMVYGFVKQSGGHIKIYSELGEGTTMRLYVPRLVGIDGGDVPDRATLSPAQLPCSKGESILVVEDDPAVRQLTSYILEELGYIIRAAANADEALTLLGTAQDNDFDLLFTDIVLPSGKSGHNLAKEAKDRHPSLRVLYSSGYTENAVVHGGRLDDGIDLLEKPYRRDQLVIRIRAILDADEPGPDPDRTDPTTPQQHSPPFPPVPFRFGFTEHPVTAPLIPQTFGCNAERILNHANGVSIQRTSLGGNRSAALRRCPRDLDVRSFPPLLYSMTFGKGL